MIHKIENWLKSPYECSCGDKLWGHDIAHEHVGVSNQDELNKAAVELARMVIEGPGGPKSEEELAVEISVLAEALEVK